MHLALSLLVLLLHLALCAYQPLQLDKPVTSYIQYGNIYFDYSIPRTSQADVLFCFMPTQESITSTEQDQSDGSKIATCKISDVSDGYFCVRLYGDGGGFRKEQFYKTIDINTIWAADKRLTMSKNSNIAKVTTTNIPILTQNSTAIQVELQSEALTQTLIIKNYFSLKSIYHMFTCPSWSNNTSTCSTRWKQNYLHTFKHPQKKMNLIVQRIHNCGIYKKLTHSITSHIFYGGALRNGQYYMFTAVLTYLSNESQILNMWGGLAYCSDHANRDMFCYATDGSAFDAVSLIAGAVYKDVAANINGTDDAELVDNFYSDRYSQYYMYFIQYHRPYTTVNQVGDQVITKKIYAEFSFAAYFDIVSNSQNVLVTPSCLQKEYKHNFLMVFESDVEVSEPWRHYVMIAILILLAFL